MSIEEMAKELEQKFQGAVAAPKVKAPAVNVVPKDEALKAEALKAERAGLESALEVGGAYMPSAARSQIEKRIRAIDGELALEAQAGKIDAWRAKLKPAMDALAALGFRPASDEALGDALDMPKPFRDRKFVVRGEVVPQGLSAKIAEMAAGGMDRAAIKERAKAEGWSMKSVSDCLSRQGVK
jgi:hypothetical protein